MWVALCSRSLIVLIPTFVEVRAKTGRGTFWTLPPPTQRPIGLNYQSRKIDILNIIIGYLKLQRFTSKIT